MTDKMHSGHENVVPLKTKPERAASVALTRLPAPMHSLRDKARQQLQGRLRELFEKADDALFELADQSNNNQEQNLYFDSMREVRLRRRAMESAFFRRLDIGFAQLLDPQAYRDEQPTEKPEVSIDDLSLVQNDELEELVATEGMINKANDEFAEPIQHLTLRIDHLVPVKVYKKNNPLGADVVCSAFTEAARTAEIDVKAKLVLFKLFDKLVVTQLGPFYQSLNQLLAEANIMPSLSRGARIKKSPASPSSVPSSNSYGAGVSAGYTRPDGQRQADNDSQANQANEVLHTLRDLLGSSQGGPRSSQGSGEALQSDDLVSLLSRAQQHDTVHPGSGGHHQAVDIRAMLNSLLDGQRKQTINEVDEDVINLVSMMFEFILDDRNLAAPMKALLGRLQIPMVKVAIADKSFFSKGGHPARRLLNEMANAALGWQERGDAGRRTDNLYTKMEIVVQTILSDFETDMGIFNQLLLDFRSYLEKDKRRAQILEQRTLDAEDGKARSERARAQVNQALDRITAEQTVPPEAEQLLREAWANVMFITGLKEGIDSDGWREVCDTAEQLVWTVCAPMDKANRQKLLKTVPRLLPRLRSGLESISYNPYSMTQLFKQLERLHLTRLRGQSVAPEQPAKPEASVAEADKIVEDVNLDADIGDVSSDPDLDDLLGDEVADKTAGKTESPENHVEQAEPSVPSVESSAEAVEARAEESTEAVAEESVSPVASAPVAEELAEGDQHLALVGQITQGSWFEMQDEQGQGYRCRLAAIIKPTGKYIFVNRSGMKVAEETRQGLALALKTGRLRVLDDSMLFDRALEAVIGNLRSARAR